MKRKIGAQSGQGGKESYPAFRGVFVQIGLQQPVQHMESLFPGKDQARAVRRALLIQMRIFSQDTRHAPGHAGCVPGPEPSAQEQP